MSLIARQPQAHDIRRVFVTWQREGERKGKLPLSHTHTHTHQAGTAAWHLICLKVKWVWHESDERGNERGSECRDRQRGVCVTASQVQTCLCSEVIMLRTVWKMYNPHSFSNLLELYIHIYKYSVNLTRLLAFSISKQNSQLAIKRV